MVFQYWICISFWIKIFYYHASYNEKYEIEASGGVNLNNIKKITKTGVDRISIGCLTHSVTALDFKLEI